VLRAARIPCSLGEVFDFVKPGERVWFDDGKINGVVTANDGQEISIEIGFTGPKGSRLRPEKGINLPDTDIVIPALTEKDVADLTTMVGVVDLVGLSFVRRPEDIYLLEDHLTRLDAQRLGIVLKIENRFAFDHLPQLLLAALRSPPVGVMVARGDLAVEVGFDRLAEVQEEILWLCEAAHVPVIWATQVLEEMARTGMPSRAEVTDAAMSGRAECVMLNKGPYIVEAVDFLGEVLERMNAHQSKKTAMLRKLAVSRMA
jgi:pyruvate kinase